MIIKRDGTKVAFDRNRIINAIKGANKDVEKYDRIDDSTIEEICSYLEETFDLKNKDYNVEEIQDMIETDLMDYGYSRLASEYIKFRYKKEVAREAKRDFIDAIREKLDASDVQNQNANVDEHSFGGRVGEASSVVTKQLALDYIVSPQTRENHINNEVYIHDLDSYYVGSHNCLSVPFDDLLANGFKTRQTDVRPTGSVNTAFQLVAVIFQLQSLQQFG